MGFNYAAEKKKFETLWARLRREYRAAGMSDTAIQKMHDFDWKVFKQERIYGDQFKEILDEQTALKELRAFILTESREHAEADRRIRDAAGMLENAVPHIAEWDESAVRQLVAQVKVLSKNEISVTLKSGIEIRQSIAN